MNKNWTRSRCAHVSFTRHWNTERIWTSCGRGSGMCIIQDHAARHGCCKGRRRGRPFITHQWSPSPFSSWPHVTPSCLATHAANVSTANERLNIHAARFHLSRRSYRATIDPVYCGNTRSCGFFLPRIAAYNLHGSSLLFFFDKYHSRKRLSIVNYNTIASVWRCISRVLFYCHAISCDVHSVYWSSF